jgi:hypothetical protein
LDNSPVSLTLRCLRCQRCSSGGGGGHSKVSVLAAAARLGKSFMDNLVKNNNLLLFLLIMSTKIFPNC